MAGVRGLEPRNAWIKTMCLNQLGHTPINLSNIESIELAQALFRSTANRSIRGDLFIPFTT